MDIRKDNKIMILESHNISILGWYYFLITLGIVQ